MISTANTVPGGGINLVTAVALFAWDVVKFTRKWVDVDMLFSNFILIFSNVSKFCLNKQNKLSDIYTCFNSIRIFRLAIIDGINLFKLLKLRKT